ALSSSWYCAGTSGAATTLVLANAGTTDVAGRVAIVSATAPPAGASVVVPALGASSLQLTDLAPGPLAAVVDLDGGQVAAELVVNGSGDYDVTPCASAASADWFLAEGSTAKDAVLSLSLFNPFPEDAIADLSFSTEQGRAVPADFQGLVVPGRSLVVTLVGEHVRRRDSVATHVRARSGRLVVVQHQSGGVGGRAGVSVTLAAPSAGTAWYFADGTNGPGLVERFTVFNPGGTEAIVLVEVDPDEGVVEPFERVVPAGGQLQFVLDDQAGVPAGMPHATTVRSLSGPPVVVSRATEGAPPSPRVGRADTLGARRPATTWVFPAGGSARVDEWIMVTNPGPAPAEVSLSNLVGGQETPAVGLAPFVLEPGRRRSVPLAAAAVGPAVPVIVRASAPLVAERALYGAPGLSTTVGIPLG
ncbi:MAG: DUF5719 family protein, partial [Acidimicrobiales bacterium]